MEPIRVALSGFVGMILAASWLFCADLWVKVFVTILGAAVIEMIWTGAGGRCLSLCLSEAFAVSLGMATPLLGVLIQPLIAWILIGGRDLRGLIMGSIVIAISAGIVFVDRHTLQSLLIFVAGVGVIALCLTVIEVWVQQQLSGGEKSV